MRNRALAIEFALPLEDAMGTFNCAMFAASGLLGLVICPAGVISIFHHKPLLPDIAGGEASYMEGLECDQYE